MLLLHPRSRKVRPVQCENEVPETSCVVFPIFSKPSPSTFRWAKFLGPSGSCLHGMNLEPKPSTKVAAFDLDGCLIESSIGKKQDALNPFKWWRPIVPSSLKELHNEGFAIVILTNQALRGATAIANWKKKIPTIADALSDVPFNIFAATAKDGFRKPMPGMWYGLEELFLRDGVSIADREASFFVGDAAGRAADHAATDRKFALNVGIRFSTPEEYFLKLPQAPYKVTGFHVSSLPTNLPLYTPTATPLLPSSPKSTPEIVVFVGFPSLGKTSFYRRHFEPSGYVHVNQDTLKSRDKCIKAVEIAVQDGRSCVVDNTNRDAVTRKHYVDIAKRHKIHIRCILFDGSIELAWHNNLYRAFNMPPSSLAQQTKRELLPYSALADFRSKYEEPHLSEGFKEIKKVNWVFSGSEEERRRWSMWLQIDGK
ncbi:unnamed protein product [Somion occarium]|uniref:PNK3P-domain-containing protein n=1 Tax=Somion occarium TaxID=3059160 RepID=A0ABP1DAZ2_9APHY